MKIVISSTIQEQVYNIIKQDVINGTFHTGEQLKEADLAERFQVSRSPVREALRQLAGDGVLVILPNKGIYVREFTPKYIRDVLDLRVLLEQRGIENLPRLIDDETKRNLLSMRGEMKELLHRGSSDVERHDAIDRNLHNLIMSFNDNEFITEVAAKIATLNSMFRNLSLSDPARAQESQMEHIELIDCLVRGETEQAQEINKAHIGRTIKRVIAEMEKRKSL